MVVGKSGTVVEAVTLRARPTVVRASGRACKVNGSTPLAALAAALTRGARRPARARLRRAASGATARSSGQLFVDRVGRRPQPRPGRLGLQGQRLRAQRRRGGRLRPAAAQRRPRAVALLRDWTPRRAAASARCASAGAAPAGPPGSSLRVRVRGTTTTSAARHLSRARRVALGPASAVTDATGHATLVRPAAGSHTLVATAPGAIPSFPVRGEGGLMRAVLAALLALVALALAGCSVGAGDPQDGSATLVVTRDFGAQRLLTGARGSDPGRRDGDALPDAQGEGRRDALRRALRERDRRRALADRRRRAARLALLRERHRGRQGRGRARGPSRATGSGGTTATGARRCACRPSSAPIPSRSCTGPRASASPCASTVRRMHRPVRGGARPARARRRRDGSRPRSATAVGKDTLRLLVGGVGGRARSTRPPASSRRDRRRAACSRGPWTAAKASSSSCSTRGDAPCGRSARAAGSSRRPASRSSSRPGS